MRLLLLLLLTAPLGAVTYSVGPGQTYADIGDAPLESLAAGDILEIHWRAAPYAEKFVICAQGTAASPIIVRGIPDGSGNLPVLTGNNAVTRTQLSYWNQERSLIKIGGASVPSDTTPQHIIVENLELRSAHSSYTFTNASGTPGVSYIGNAAAIYIEKGKNITIRGCTIHDCGNGIFVAPGGGTTTPASMTENILIRSNYIYGNGNVSSIYEHNTYCEAYGITYEFNHYGPLRTGAGGNNLKCRSGNCVIRYNWIEDGNRQLDLVEAYSSGIQTLTGYGATFVYGNVLIKPVGTSNNQIIHYGGDNGGTQHYRKGTLHLYNNTIYSLRTGNTTLVRLSTNDETCDCRNNIIFVTANGSNLAMLNEAGTINLRNCFTKAGFVNSHSAGTPTVNVIGGMVTGTDPGWVNAGTQDFTLTTTAASRDVGTTLHASALPLTLQYQKHQQQQARPVDATLDIGAFEFDNGGAPVAPAAPSGLTATALAGLSIQIGWTDNSSNEDGFEIERSDNGGAFAMIQALGANVTSFTDSGLTEGVLYAYRVRAKNTVGNSAYSNTASATAVQTLPTPPPGGGGGSKSGGGGGCSTGDGYAWWLLALLPLVLFARPTPCHSSSRAMASLRSVVGW